MAMPGQPLIRIEDNRNLRLEVTVKEQEVLQIRQGQAVTVQIEAAELSQALATGVAEAFISSGSTGYDRKVWEQLNYFYDAQAWLPRNYVFANKDAYNGLSDLV